MQSMHAVCLALAWFGMPLHAQPGNCEPLEAPAGKGTQPAEPGGGLEFTLGEIPPLSVSSEGHVSTTRNGVRFDVFFDSSQKTNAAIYAINTGRRQLVLTPDKHKAILDDLVRRKFTVIVADFRDKPLKGLELEKYVLQLTADAREAADGIFHPSLSRRPPAAKDTTSSKTETCANDYFTLMPGNASK